MRNGVQLVATQLEQKYGVHITVIYEGATDFTVGTEMPVLTALEATHVDALLVVPADQTGVNAPIKWFADQGIPVITLDTTSSLTSALVSSITSNGEQGGAQAADLIAKAANEKGTVAVNSIAPGVTTTDA